MDKRKWYELEAQMGHQGAGRSSHADIYLWAGGISAVLIRYRHMGATKKNIMPNVRTLSNAESAELEKRIVQDGLKVSEAKRKWYTTSEEYRWW